jgi:galactitol-specific phosphotransferase system IIB component
MKIVTVCKEGNNRSVTLAHLLKYKYKADVLPIGVASCSPETQKMLYEWADHIIVADVELMSLMPDGYETKTKLWNVGPDIFPRPFNPELLAIAKQLIEENPL